MKIEIPDPKFKHGQRVFFLKEEPTQHGIQHRCSQCEQLHYAEHYMPIVVEGLIAGYINWNLDIGRNANNDELREPNVRGPVYQIDDVARDGGRFMQTEDKIFASAEEAHAAKRPMEIR
jgi:hypothetical protein